MKLHTGVQGSYFQVGYSLPIQQHLPTELQNALAAGSSAALSTGDDAHTLNQAPSINYELNDAKNDPNFNSDEMFHPKLKFSSSEQ